MHNEIILPPSDNPRVPVAEYAFRHLTRVQLRFNDIDMLGHVNNSVYLEAFDLAKVQYFQAVADGRLDWRKVNIVVANINCDFFAPTFFDEEVGVITTVTRIGEKSLSLEQRLINVTTGQVKTVCRTVMVGIDLKTGHSAAVDLDWVKAVATYEGRVV